MVAPLTFEVPNPAQSVRPAIKATRDIEYKDYLLKVTFTGQAIDIGPENLPVGLRWSSSLECPYVYLPSAKAGEVISLENFWLPAGARAIKLSITTWSPKALPPQSSFSNMILETRILDRPAVIVGKEG
ncbi:hypothetical protein BAURA63_03698 [Brevibacterium aurantiacum]|uniref:Uncharacterized protein n=1 Tax=Brevibacterium aurantiacum TaxID=273384 RepID=A0A2H1KTF3_BREAU|nr:hypothetical protein BAURA63_03698 [Brevibacterium aurantiacum]